MPFVFSQTCMRQNHPRHRWVSPNQAHPIVFLDTNISGTHTCESWELQNYFDELEAYTDELREFSQRAWEFAEAAAEFAAEATEYANCEIQSVSP